jgi:hypothetical protein
MSGFGKTLNYYFFAVTLICSIVQAADYDFIRIANFDADEISTVPGNAAIKNNGDVIFTVSYPTGLERTFIGNGSVLTPVLDTAGPISSIFYHSRINDNRQFAYRAIMDDGSQSLFRHSSSGEELIRTTTSGSFSAVPSINSNGDVAYLACDDSISPYYLYRWNGSEELILDTSGAYSWLEGWPSIADNCDIVVNTKLNSSADNLIIANNNSTKVILDGTGIFEGEGVSVMSKNGSIAFFSPLNSNNRYAIGRYYQNNVELIFGDEGDEPTNKHVSNFPGINDSGVVAFMGSIDNTTQGYIYDSALVPVLSVGDVLDNKIVSGLGLQGDGCINNLGHLAFTIRFDDGSWGVYAAVPEPCTLSLMVFGVLALRRKRW